MFRLKQLFSLMSPADCQQPCRTLSLYQSPLLSGQEKQQMHVDLPGNYLQLQQVIYSPHYRSEPQEVHQMDVITLLLQGQCQAQRSAKGHGGYLQAYDASILRAGHVGLSRQLHNPASEYLHLFEISLLPEAADKRLAVINKHLDENTSMILYGGEALPGKSITAEHTFSARNLIRAARYGKGTCYTLTAYAYVFLLEGCLSVAGQPVCAGSFFECSQEQMHIQEDACWLEFVL